MAAHGFSKFELIFIKAPPEEIEIECPICLQVMLNDPHLVSCCGHHFCRTCIKRVKDNNRACPYCKEKEYQTMPDKGHLRIINGLKVNCTNISCEWKGELKDLPVHLNKGKREGQCQYEEVTCAHSDCEIKKQRQYLVKHEKDECAQRRVLCYYCNYKGTYQFIVKEHYPECTQYPVPCPKKCGFRALLRGNIPAHLTEECPLQSVECEFKWAGCQYTSLRKDLQQHNNDSQLEHMSLLAKECGELKKENEKLKKATGSIEHKCDDLKRENKELKQKMIHIHHTVFGNTYPILPVHVPLNGQELHFYSEPFGHHMSASVFAYTLDDFFVDFKVYEEKFHQPKVSIVIAKIDGVTITLTTDDDISEEFDSIANDAIQNFILQVPQCKSFEIINIY